MNILVIGGTYFLGKKFVELAVKDNKLFLLNRGNRKVAFDSETVVTEFFMDRHDTERLKKLKEHDFDVVVDFCAYEKGDIATIVESVGGKIKQYIFISTCDVYRRGTGKLMDEEGEFEDRDFGGEAGAYILGKVALERELQECCQRYDIKYTSIRPAFIYGPENYAPREGIFFNWIKQAGQIIYPEDADGSFQMVYVKDVAEIILASCGNIKAWDKAYNVCGEERYSYEIFAKALKQATDTDFESVNLSVHDIQNRNIPLPFPLTDEESQWYRGERVKELGVDYTSIETGLTETFKWFSGLS